MTDIKPACTVTVLVAVYNASAYLRRCIDSLLSQTLSDIQILCIDDASTDSSVQIIRDYADTDHRVELVQLDTNGGAAHARNVGLSRARGRYITFVDSDDWLSPDALSLCVEKFERHADTDCVLFTQVRCYSSDDSMQADNMPHFDRMSGQDAFVASLSWQVHGLYAVKASIHKQFPYDETCRAYSDDNTTRLHYLNSRYVALCRGIYYYYQHSQSITHAISVRRFDHLLANKSMRQQLLNLNASSEVLATYEHTRWLVLIDCYMIYFNNRWRLSRSDRRKARHLMREAWLTIDRSLLSRSLRRKFGYAPLHKWWIFRVEEELYFFLRKALRPCLQRNPSH